MDLLMTNVFSVKKENREYCFVVPHGAPYGEAIDSCFEVLAKLSEMQKEALDSLKKKEDEATPVTAEVVS